VEYPDRRYSIRGKMDVFDAFLVKSSEWMMSREIDLLTFRTLALDCDRIVELNRTNSSLLKSKKVRHFLKFWNLTGCLELVEGSYTREFLRANMKVGNSPLKFLNPRSINSERFKRYQNLQIEYYKREPQKFPPKRFVGVGYSDKGCSRVKSYDGSPTWQEVSSDFDFQESNIKYQQERLKRAQSLVRDVSFNQSDPRRTRIKSRKRIVRWYRETYLTTNNLFFD
jgi:hypothetical protein